MTSWPPWEVDEKGRMAQKGSARTGHKVEDYFMIKTLGEGAYGVVYKAKSRKTGEIVAVKLIKTEGYREERGIPRTALREMVALQDLEHPNIVAFKDVLMEDSKIYLVFEFMAMDLRKYMDVHVLGNGEQMDRMLIKSYLHQILQGILFCHQRRILHRDLKPQNLLIDEDGGIKIADFGLARAIEPFADKVYTHEVVTLWYRPPEILLGNPLYENPIDMWSIGTIFAEMVNGQPLFEGDSEIDQLFKIFKVMRTPTEDIWPGVTKLPDFKFSFPKWTDPDGLDKIMNKSMDNRGLDLLESMLIYDPDKRITAKEALCHPYFDNLDKTTLPATIDEYDPETIYRNLLAEMSISK